MTQSEQKKVLGEWEEVLAGRLIKKAEEDEAGSTELSAQSPDSKNGEVATAEKEQALLIPELEPEGTSGTEFKIESIDAPGESRIVTPKFAKVEKSLAALGFFTPSSRRLKDQKVKRINFTREVDGKRVDVTAEIIPSTLYGLPITADQDKYIALQEIITNILQTEGQVKNPIRFKSADLLRLMNRNAKAGKNYKEIGAWLDVMFSTTIFSQGTVWKAGEKRFAKDRFRVFDRAVSVGKELDDGTIADANYVWLSAWQLDNINQKFLLPIDLKTYRELKNHITKALVPLLQIWLFASQKAGSFEKRYDELCEILNLQVYKAPSLITRQLKPSLDELTHYEYLKKWRIEKTVDRKAYKIIFYHGPKFYRDGRRRLEQKNQVEETLVIAESQEAEPKMPEPGKAEPEPDLKNAAVPEAGQMPPPQGERETAPGEREASGAEPSKPEVPEPGKIEHKPEVRPEGREAADPKITSALTERGIFKNVARKLILSLPADRLESVSDYIDYWDSVPADKRGPGLLHDLIKNGDPLPPSFETRRKRQEREAAQARNVKIRQIKDMLSNRYEEHREAVVERFISEEINKEEFERRVAAHKAELSMQKELWSGRIGIRSELAEKIARSTVRDEIAKQIVISFEEFRERELPRILAELNIQPAEFGFAPQAKPAVEGGNIPSNEK